MFFIFYIVINWTDKPESFCNHFLRREITSTDGKLPAVFESFQTMGLLLKVRIRSQKEQIKYFTTGRSNFFSFIISPKWKGGNYFHIRVISLGVVCVAPQMFCSFLKFHIFINICNKYWYNRHKKPSNFFFFFFFFSCFLKKKNKNKKKKKKVDVIGIKYLC